MQLAHKRHEIHEKEQRPNIKRRSKISYPSGKPTGYYENFTFGPPGAYK